MIKADYHFHPNLDLKDVSKAEEKSKQIWRKFEEVGLNIVFSSEHAYKNPRKSYEFLNKYKPEDSKTFLVPAIECLSKEGVDIIAFSKLPEQIYSYKELMTPYGLPIDDIVDLIDSDPNLHGIVVHPHTPGTTSILRNSSLDTTLRAIKKLGILEKHNCSFTSTLRLLKMFGLHKIARRFYKQMLDTRSAPEDLCEHARVLTVGSDAHSLDEIGDCAVIDKEYKNNYDYLFNVVINNSGNFYEFTEVPLKTIIFGARCVLSEWLIKTRRSYTIDENYG